MDGSDPESALIGELQRLAGGESKQDFALVWEGVRVAVSYTSGSSHTVVFSVLYDLAASGRPGGGVAAGAATYRDDSSHLTAIRPMRVTLVPEETRHIEGKKEGIDVEYQTGDARFDQAVYIDSPTADPLPRLFTSEVVRSAVLDLFALSFTSITIDDLNSLITARANSFPDLRPQTGTPGRNALNAFARLAKGLPPVKARLGGKHAKEPLQAAANGVLVMSLASFAGGPLTYFYLSGKMCDGDDVPFVPCFGPGLAGLAIGLVVGFVVIALVKPSLKARYAGTSRSSKRVDTFCTLLRLLILTSVGSAAGIIIMQLFRTS